MELMAAGMKDHGTSEAAYVTGMLSLVHALFDVPVGEILKKGHFDGGIQAALTTREGSLGGLLEVAERFERGDYPECTRWAERLGIPMKDVLAAQTTAITECCAGSMGGRADDNGPGRPLQAP
jgi:EAL and modified HD-GYP domain-containing signal transduction protein